MAHKDDLKSEAEDLGITLEGTESVAKLEELIAEHNSANQTEPPTVTTPQEIMVPLSDVKKLIAEAIQAQSEKDKPQKVKKVTEHHAHLFRLNGKWVVDFADRNYDYENKKIIDPYIKEKVHAYNVFNQQKRENEAWIKLIFQDGTTEELPLNRYVERRTMVYCKIEKREKVDTSYVIGEVEIKKESGDMNKGTGIMRDQEVEMHREIFHIVTPEGDAMVVPEYVVC